MPSLSADPFTLDDPRIPALDHLLGQRAAPFGGMGLEQLDGFLSALVVGPELVPPSEWQPRVWGKTPPRWENLEEAAEAQALLMALWNTAARRVRFGGDELPMDCLPFWWLPEDPDAEHGDDVDIGAAWAAGFLEGMDARGDAWDAWIGNDDWIGDIEAHLEALAVGDYAPEDGAGPPMPLSYRQRLEIYASLPDMLHDLNCHRLQMLGPREPVRVEAAPGRNDVCPCGSGRKFKKCCGAPERLN